MLYFLIGTILGFIFMVFEVFAFVLEIGFDEDNFTFEMDSFDPLVFEEDSFALNTALSFLVAILISFLYPLVLLFSLIYLFASWLKKYLENKKK